MDTTEVRLARPAAPRLRRPGWRDPRLLVGVVLVAASVALGSWLVGAAGRTVPVYVADVVLVPGQVIDETVLRGREVRLDAAAEAYLSADEPVPAGLVVTRTVGAGELVPLGALSRSGDLELRPVAVTGTGALGLDAGATVDLWFVPADPADGAEPHQLAAGLTVADVTEPEGAFAVGTAVTAHVLVPLDQLAEVLTALAADGTVEVVPVPGAGR